MKINILYCFFFSYFKHQTYGELTFFFFFFKFLDEKGKLEEETPAPNPFKLNCTKGSAFYTPNKPKVWK